MPFTIRPHRRFPVQCFVSYNAGPFQGQGTVWNHSCMGWRFSAEWCGGREKQGARAPCTPITK